MRTGTIISASGHVGLILWVLLGDWLFTAHEPVEIQMTDVSVMSSEEFAALTAGDQPAAPATEVETPTQPPVDEPPPTPKPQPEPQPEVPPAVLPEPRRDPEPVPEDLPEPDSVPEPEPLPDPVPETSTEPEPVVPGPVTDAPVNDNVNPEIVLDSVAPVNPDVRPKPKPSQVVSPEVVDAPEEAADDAATPTPAVSEEVVPEEPPVEEPPEEVAPEDTGETNLTEANQDDVASTLAPTASGRPPRRPERTTPTEQPEEPTEQPATEEPATEQPATETPATDPGTEEPTEDPLADILADVQEAGSRTGLAGSPMSFNEIDALRSALNGCWKIGAVSTAAGRTKITVWLDLDPAGRPVPGSLVLKSYTDGDAASAQIMFETARRAIALCVKNGLPLPPDKYETWRELELNFDASQVLLR
ncbi:cell envelope biogenesis protein TolA [Neogemmobacter tilapiae]|uniref:Energy transducer TonB n=1 Tax=Neogemmobacter tilapiae TaxID=875041 RepID=A0A918TI31_9RHOB|nr:cell envelope biogenesis protein TolA [Gemmobacter tilapiae]GHC47989.1 hypothetical protein GCM10007315_07380 [Gemmobacter tilapiae]